VTGIIEDTFLLLFAPLPPVSVPFYCNTSSYGEHTAGKFWVHIISYFFHMKYSQFSLSVFYSVTYTSNESTQGGRNSVVGVVTHYGLDVLEFDPRLGRDFPYPSRPALWSTQPSVEWVAGHFLGVKAAWAWP
jgi:hypothetical protein